MKPKIQSYSTYAFIKKSIIKRYGAIPFAELNDELGAELVQSGLQSEAMTRLDCHLSERLFSMKLPVFEPVFTRLFFSQMVAYVDGQRACGKTIKQGVLNYLDYCGLSEDDLSLKTALKIYDRYRNDTTNA